MKDKEGATVLEHYLLVDNHSGRVVRQTFTGIDVAKHLPWGMAAGAVVGYRVTPSGNGIVGPTGFLGWVDPPPFG